MNPLRPVVGDYASLRRMLVVRTERADDIPAIAWRDTRGNPISIESAAPALRAPGWCRSSTPSRA